MTSMTVGSCFAGIGGLDLGLEAGAGTQTIWHSEIRPAASRVMSHRFPDSEPVGDLTQLGASLFGLPARVDIMAGGPPCQDISIGNAYGRLGLAGEKSGLFLPWLELVDTLKPTWVVMEQVTGLLTSSDGRDYRTVLDTFRKAGYALDVVAIDSSNLVPQARDRLILVGHRDHGAAARALLPLRQAGGRDPGTVRPPQRQPPGRTEGSPRTYRKGTRPRSVLDGETWVPAHYANTLTLNDVGVSRATVIILDKDGRPRVLTPLEWERCHGFPDNWTEAAGNDRERWQVLGNAVSPPVAELVGVGIAQAEGETGVTLACIECGNDDPCEGYNLCSDCLEKFGT